MNQLTCLDVCACEHVRIRVNVGECVFVANIWDLKPHGSSVIIKTYLKIRIVKGFFKVVKQRRGKTASLS
jgi:hypothetical protein